MADELKLIQKINIQNKEYCIAAKFDNAGNDINATYMTKANPTGVGIFKMNPAKPAAGEEFGNFSTTLGYSSLATGGSATAEGDYTRASGFASHSEGNVTSAGGDASHAEGSSTTASGDHSHAEGRDTIADGACSHAEGYCTEIYTHAAHVQGMYNTLDKAGQYAHIVGNGTANGRSNAHTLDWDGNAWFKGNIYMGGTSQNDAFSLLNIIHPIGSIFMTTNSANPATYFGFGTWVAWGSGRVPVGVDTSQTEFATVEKQDGSKTHTLTTAEMPTHTHKQKAHTHTQKAHTHTQKAHTHLAGSSNTNPYFFSFSTTHQTDTVGSISGSGYKIPRIPDNHVISETDTIRAATATNNNATATNNDATATNNDTGGGGAHNNLQPYITCYMWKRTA